MNIVRPSVEQVSKYLKQWNRLENYVQQENSLKKLFTETYPHNDDMNDVLIKVCALNDFYSTNIRSSFTVAKHIVDLDIDQRLTNRDLTLVNDIAMVSFGNRKPRNCYSFATKYCSQHYPEDYPICDGFVRRMLMHFKRVDGFYEFKKDDLEDCPTFHTILMEFRRFYGLENFTLKEVDQYLWQAGKEYFPTKY